MKLEDEYFYSFYSPISDLNGLKYCNIADPKYYYSFNEPGLLEKLQGESEFPENIKED
jgi:hypothetical protein